MTQKIKNIVIIEDNTDIREGFKILLNNTHGFEVSHVFDSCEKAILSIETIEPDVILMDIDLPGMNGIMGTKIIKSKLPKVEILIVTVFENSERVFEALCAGASGYLTKTSSPLQLITAINEVLEGGAPMSAKIARMVIGSFKMVPNELLTDREFEVLKLLVDGKSYKTIADNLSVSLGTVKFHIRNIYQKLQVDNKEDAIALARNKKLI